MYLLVVLRNVLTIALNYILTQICKLYTLKISTKTVYLQVSEEIIPSPTLPMAQVLYSQCLYFTLYL